MEYSYSIKPAKRTVVDIPATSRLLKDLRNKNGYSVKQLQEIFGFESPVAIYAWENEKCKNIPCIENFDILSKLYNCHVEDLYILKQIDFSDLQVRENTPEYQTYRTLVNHLLEGLADVTSSKGKQLYGNAKIIYHQKRFTFICRKAWGNGCSLCRGILDMAYQKKS